MGKVEMGRQWEPQEEGQGRPSEDRWLQGRKKGDHIIGWLQKQRDLQTKDQLMTL